jgi:hypothetical protein
MISRAKEKYHVEFPECASGCPCVEYFGVCECESICPHKFDLKTGAAKKLNVVEQPTTAPCCSGKAPTFGKGRRS